MQNVNIVLISIDTLRADHLSCYGYKRPTTPNIDRIAANGARFRNAYSTAVWTPPAHASMLTGLYPSQHGVTDNKRLSENIPTLAETLHAHGYVTAGFVNNPLVGAMVGLDRGHDQFHEIWRGDNASTKVGRAAKYARRKLRETLGKNDHGAQLTNRGVKTWLDKQAWSSRPFYLFLHYIEPHNPIGAPKPFRHKFVDPRLDDFIDKEKLARVAHNPLCCFTDEIRLTKDELTYLIALYDGEIAYVDAMVGEVVQTLRQMQMLENTLLIITADHGEHFGEHGMFSHVSSLYEPIVHVPLIVHHPKFYQPGSIYDGPVQTIDIFPTVLDLLATSYPGPVAPPGRSLLPAGGKLQLDAGRPIIAEWEGRVPKYVKRKLRERHLNSPGDYDFMTQRMKMVRKQNHKYILREDGDEQLFNLASDPTESRNLATSEPAICDALKRHLSELEDMALFSTSANEVEMNDDVKARLQDLGYL